MTTTIITDLPLSQLRENLIDLAIAIAEETVDLDDPRDCTRMRELHRQYRETRAALRRSELREVRR